MTEPPARSLRHVRAGALSGTTAQTPGMDRLAAISGPVSDRIWMGETRMAPGATSGAHHHGDSETAIFVVSGHPAFACLEDGREVRIDAEPGDYVYVPPFTPHREENRSTTEEAVVVIARSTQEAIVVNLGGLSANISQR